MKVCYVEVSSSKLNGSQQSLLNLMSVINNMGITPFLAGHEHWEMLDIAEKKGFQTIAVKRKQLVINKKDFNFTAYVKYPLKRIYNELHTRKAIKFINENQIDIVHLNTTMASEIWARAALACHIPYVWHVREFLDQDHDRVPISPDYTYGLMRKANAVIAISESIQAYWEKRLGRKCELVYNGLPKEEYYDPSPIKFKNELIDCIIVGRVTESKGQFDAVRAVEETIRRGFKNIHLNIVGFRGTDAYEKKIANYVKTHELIPYITFTDYTYDMKPLREKADIGLMCSRAEAFGRVTIEYMLSGMLVIGTNSGGTPELITENKTGHLYPYGDWKKLADILTDAATNRAHALEVAAAGQKHALKSFLIERTAGDIKKIYDKLLSETRG